MEQSTFRRYSIMSQLGFALVFFLINFLENFPYSPFFEAFIYALNYTVMVAGVVAINYFFLFQLFIAKKWWRYFSLLFLVMTAFIWLHQLIDAGLPFLTEEEPDSETFELLGLLYDYLLLTISAAYTSLFYFVEKWLANASIEARLRNEKLQAELNFLKSQINPHFLFNTLNNIYAYAQVGHEKTPAMLERLSSILRFMVYDCSADRVSLGKELEAVEDLLEILKMKNTEQHNISLSVQGVKRFHLIAPLIMVNFVENACKHSDVVNNPEGFVRVAISVDAADACQLSISNTFRTKAIPMDQYGGVGMNNIKQRLELQYASNYTLTEEKLNGVYSLSLTIPLERKQ